MYSGNAYNQPSIPSDYQADGERTMVCRTMDEARAQLYNEYGSNYYITNHQTQMTGGFLGLFQHSQVIVRYVVRNPAAEQEETFQQAKEKIPQNADFDAKKYFAQLDKNIQAQFTELKNKMGVLSSVSDSSKKHPSIEKIEEILIENEFTLSYINSITTKLQGLSINELDDYTNVCKTVMEWIGKSIKIYPHEPRKLPHVIILVGPTGVGKTTTIAKLAGTMIKSAQKKNLQTPKIRMITIDHTRVGAEEQLRRFGEIMYIDVDTANSPEEIKKIYDMYKDSLDALFIDTPGYSPNDYEHIGQMRALLKDDFGMNADIYLTVTASVKAKDLVSIISHYETFEFNSVIITKWDETSAVGNVLSVLSERGKPVSYITDGQRVPNMIEKATVQRFLKNLSDFGVEHKYIEELFPEDK